LQKKMKILQIIPNLKKDGAERLVLDICTELAKRNSVEVKLAVFSNANNYIDTSKNINIVDLKTNISLSVTKRNQLNITQLQELMNNFEPDIIHSHSFEAEIVSRSCYYPKAKWFSHCHDNMIQLKIFEFNASSNKTRLTNFYEKKYLLDRYKINGGTHFI